MDISTRMESQKENTVTTPMQPAEKSAYAAAGVNIDVKMDALKAIKTMVNATKTVNVVGGIGSFGGLCRLPQGSPKDTLLVSSTDGVGTKLKVAVMMKKHDTVGQDIVNHCVNDILVQGARPLFFMDYVGASKIDGSVFQQIVGTDPDGDFGPKTEAAAKALQKYAGIEVDGIVGPITWAAALNTL